MSEIARNSLDEMFGVANRALKEVVSLKSENDRLREALEDILKHQNLIIGEHAKYSVTAKIAKQALADKGDD